MGELEFSDKGVGTGEVIPAEDGGIEVCVWEEDSGDGEILKPELGGGTGISTAGDSPGVDITPDDGGKGGGGGVVTLLEETGGLVLPLFKVNQVIPPPVTKTNPQIPATVRMGIRRLSGCSFIFILSS
jgi:hypothetical protein